MDVLIATPDPETSHSLADAITRRGHSAAAASDGTDLIKRCLKGDVDMVLLHLHTGPMSGVELVGLLRELDDDLLVVPIVDQNEDGLEFAIRSLGVFYYVLAPISDEELDAVLKSAERRFEADAQDHQHH